MDVGICRYRGLGSADWLQGHRAIIAVFVDDPVSSWRSCDRSEVEKHFRSAIEWVERQASDRGTGLHLSRMFLPHNCRVHRVGVRIGMRINEMDVAAGRHHATWMNCVLSRFLQKRGSVAGLWTELFTHHGPSDDGKPSAVFFCVRRDPIPCSIAFPFWQGEDGEFRKERGIIYDKGFGGQWYLDSQIAHELLHLFGAVDLADGKIPTGHTETLRAIRKNREGNSVMFMPTQKPIDEYTIGDLTAFLIGWRDRTPDWLPNIA